MVAGYRVVARNFYGLLRVEDEGNPRMNQDANRKAHPRDHQPRRAIPARAVPAPAGHLLLPAIGHRADHAGAKKDGRGASESWVWAAAHWPLTGGRGIPCGSMKSIPWCWTLRGGIHVPWRHAGASRGGAGRRPAIVGVGAQPAVRSSGNGRFFRRFRAGPPHHARSVPHVFSPLKPSGILAVNITNTYLDLRPVVERAAAGFGKVALVYDYEPEYDDFLCFGCSWA